MVTARIGVPRLESVPQASHDLRARRKRKRSGTFTDASGYGDLTGYAERAWDAVGCGAQLCAVRSGAQQRCEHESNTGRGGSARRCFPAESGAR